MTAGLVFAGGRSQRFGREKAVERLGKRTLLECSLAVLGGSCTVLAVSAAAGSQAASLATALGHPFLSDDPVHAQGPLAGLAAGLIWARAGGFETLATLPCDTPHVEAADMARLIASLGEANCAFAHTPDGAHGLCAVWKTTLVDDLAARLATGDHPAVRDYLAQVHGRPVHFADAHRFANINRPEDLPRC